MFVRCSCSSRFLSTLSLRRATRGEIHANSQQEFLSTLSLRRATINVYHRIFGEGISIHALLAESDGPELGQLFGALISIHALLAESDPKSFRGRRCPANFYPRSPCGERRNATGHGPDGRLFLSTLSLRRATGCPGGKNAVILHFYPRSPCGERLSFIIYSITDNCISIHALLAESDIELAFLAINPITFLSTLSLRRATPGAKSTTPERYYFYPRSPCGERPVTARIIDPTYDFYPRSPCGERRRQRPGS